MAILHYITILNIVIFGIKSQLYRFRITDILQHSIYKRSTWYLQMYCYKLLTLKLIYGHCDLTETECFPFNIILDFCGISEYRNSYHVSSLMHNIKHLFSLIHSTRKVHIRMTGTETAT